MRVIGETRRYAWLLATLLVMQIMAPLMTRATTLTRIANTLGSVLIYGALFRTVLDTTFRRWLGGALAGCIIAINVTRTVLPDDWELTLEVASSVLSSALYLFVLYLIVRHVFRARLLGVDEVVGVFSGYLVIALLWGRLYTLAWTLMPESFGISPEITWQLEHWETRHALFDYYSTANLSTVGYGDIMTRGPASNTLLWLEVVCGQFYLAIVVAIIVGIKVAQALSPPNDGGSA